MIPDIEVDPAILNDPSVLRMMQNLSRGAGEAATEVYRLDGETPDKNLYFDVFSMREWAAINAEKVMSTICWDRVKRLFSNGAIDVDRLMNHTVNEKMDPIIIGADAAGPQNDQILDGAHRMVAYALAASNAGLEGTKLPLPAYLLQPHEWKQFLIPNFVAKALHFDVGFDETKVTLIR